MLFTEDQKTLQEATQLFARERLMPFYMQRERAAKMDRDLLREMGALGFIGPDLPAEYGGMDATAVTTGMIIEALSYGDFNAGALAVVQSLCGAVLLRNASRMLCQEWLPRVTKGEAILALAVTEPHAGSDASALRLRARAEGNVYVIDGEKPQSPMRTAPMLSSSLPAPAGTVPKVLVHLLYLPTRQVSPAPASTMSAAICPVAVRCFLMPFAYL